VGAAGRLTWWAACRRVVAELKGRFRDPFVPDPPCGTIVDEASALDHICTSSWFLKLKQEADRTGQQDVSLLLSGAYQDAQSQLSDGSWSTEFAGKEIYRDVGSRVCDRNDPALRHYRPSQVEFDIDLAKDIAAWQSANNRVPQDLVDLLAALRARVTAPTPPP
jgi:hypothetical protein